jgi:hypothetical protein
MGEAVENERLTASGGNSFFCVWLPTDLILGNMSTARCFWVAASVAENVRVTLVSQ